jgi:hypothetical protein
VNRTGSNLSVGDRDLPLEADTKIDLRRDNNLIGNLVEVSPIAGGDLKALSGKAVKISGVLIRFGEIVGYEVTYQGGSYIGSAKDLFVDRSVLEDIQPPTPTSHSIRETLVHWKTQRTYWHTRIDGLENLCFELASLTPRTKIVTFPWGWRFIVPEPMPNRVTMIDCLVVQHGNFWTMSMMVYPVDYHPLVGEAYPLIEDHWARTFAWANEISRGMIDYGFPWKEARKDLLERAKLTSKVLRPKVADILSRVLAARRRRPGDGPVYPPGSITAAFSEVRLKAGKVGLVEPPTDRRAYSVMSVAPHALKDPEYFEQVLLHESIHLAVAETNGEPHEGMFLELATELGLKEKFRD